MQEYYRKSKFINSMPNDYLKYNIFQFQKKKLQFTLNIQFTHNMTYECHIMNLEKY